MRCWSKIGNMKESRSKIIKALAIIFFAVTALVIIVKTWFSSISTFWVCIFFAVAGFIGAIIFVQQVFYPELFDVVLDRIIDLWNSITDSLHI